MGVNYCSITVRRESYFTCEVHLRMVCISSGAYKVYDFFISDNNPSIKYSNYCFPKDLSVWSSTSELQKTPVTITLFDEGDCNDGSSSEFCI